MLMASVAASERARFFTIKSPEHASKIQWFHSNAMDGGSSMSTTDTANKRMRARVRSFQARITKLRFHRVLSDSGRTRLC